MVGLRGVNEGKEGAEYGGVEAGGREIVGEGGEIECGGREAGGRRRVSTVGGRPVAAEIPHVVR